MFTLRHGPIYLWLSLVSTILLVSTYLWGSALQNQRNQQLSLTTENSDSSSDKRAQAQRLAIAQLASDPDYASSDIARVSRGLSKIL